MRGKSFVSLLALVALAGCAGGGRHAAADHPASASAPEAPHPAASPGLAPDEFDRARPAVGGAAGARAVPGSPSEPAAMYACPMHPEVIQATPGTCPKCGMRLVPKEDGE